ncbi:alpha-ketoglutarate-dependent dioxygenase AlkB [Acinetobacter gerneri]|jgi:alkylated DNA repair dioxygenase AlkB|uniref:Alpha-ketoglutarate-dependent dioxygenase AlkB n=1 Tax=Acinetobacter gerneri TaxID=202952 RepID=A0AAW8JNQ5_9GAMM|nr:alpha-ketoglutarate-dependent dioxygenase AlkB [Acinetobacter gerneri]MCH4243530.1 alpha-ketoglutarate-dependent dioxygenase AlkB [Acinetobacter gerneri]MDQ9011824.1 alpha-ketoglutarate-dependent dioxygenase AlkB [Acinetobacter gerneri]MDQ9015929.1 alpha-ketoglutarate-dependent dioxygenase AlkB [Acinetobacter gerneri]MDQ9027076.1 alpha-ketoglutarate-dependent dioxygenase AlkB [Acinetobacter gerneri]MDQ9054359.1 alpha-ketoglutarate-dependent dioxygenase AlkB [Acinetobacter gerneri]
MNLELFEPEAHDNLLPCDGVVQDFGLILNQQDSQKYLRYFLHNLAWQNDEVFLHGQHYITERKVVWYGDADYQYHYSGVEKQAQIWNPALFRLKTHIEQLTGQVFNSCLANLYENGMQGVGWHSDDEPSLGQQAVIASLSFGATRKFSFKHKFKSEKVDLLLQSGQLIVMKGATQRYWKHMIAKSTKIIEPRINLTFRYFYAPE